MISAIWFLMIFVGIIYSLFTGNLKEINHIVLREAQEGVNFTISLMGIMCFWLGMMKIAEKSGLMDKLAKILAPVVQFLFPEIPKGHPAEKWILMNFITNIFGIGNGATAFGLKAIKELNNLNMQKKKATNAMCMFLVINMSSLQLVPLTVLKIRQDYGSIDSTEIIAPSIIATFISTVVGIIAVKILGVKN